MKDGLRDPRFWGPLALLPVLALGLWLWHDQATPIWLSGFVALCF